MTLPLLNEYFEPITRFTVEEASGEVDGKHIIGKIKGEFFTPEGVSRNNRKYKRSLWEKVCKSPEVRQRMAERRMFGTISHKQPIDDQALLEGKISHCVTYLGIDEGGKGLGEALIFDTPAGRILNTFLRSKSKLFVSSRATGGYAGQENGIPVVDEDSYVLETFDIVLDPGFLNAAPTIAEAIENFDDVKFNHEVNEATMATKDEGKKDVLEAVTSENMTLRTDLTEALDQVSEAQKKVEEAVKENTKLKSEVERLQKLEATVAAYTLLGTPEEINTVFSKVDKQLEQVAKLGTVKEITEALTKAKAALIAYKDLGTVKEIKEAFTISLDVLKKYRSLGTLEELNKAFTVMETKAKSAKEEKKANEIKSLAAELSTDEETIREFYGKVPVESIKKLIGRTVATTKASERFVKRTPAPSTKVDEGKDDPKPNYRRHTSRISSLMEEFGGPSK